MKISKAQWIAWIGVALLLVMAWFLRGVILYFLVATLISFIGAPFMRFLQRKIVIRNRRLPRSLSAVLVLLLIIAVLVSFISIVFPPLLEQISAVSNVSEASFNKSFGEPLQDLRTWLGSMGVPAEMLTLDYLKNTLQSKLNVENISLIVEGIITGTSSAIGWIFITLFISFFLLKEKYLFYRILHALTPGKHEPRMQRIMRNLNTMLGRYLRSLLLQVFVFGTYVFIGLSIAGEKYALTIALFSGLVNLIPYVGPLLSVIFAILFSVFANIGADFYAVMVPDMYRVILVYVIAIMLDNFFSYPLIFSNSLKVHPLELFFVILAGAQIGGLPGMMLAAPMYTILRIIAKEFLSQFEIVKSMTKHM